MLRGPGEIYIKLYWIKHPQVRREFAEEMSAGWRERKVRAHHREIRRGFADEWIAAGEVESGKTPASLQETG